MVGFVPAIKMSSPQIRQARVNSIGVRIHANLPILPMMKVVWCREKEARGFGGG
jgi:hypothetical protein